VWDAVILKMAFARKRSQLLHQIGFDGFAASSKYFSAMCDRFALARSARNRQLANIDRGGGTPIDPLRQTLISMDMGQEVASISLGYSLLSLAMPEACR